MDNSQSLITDALIADVSARRERIANHGKRYLRAMSCEQREGKEKQIVVHITVEDIPEHKEQAFANRWSFHCRRSCGQRTDR